ncbi:MAG: hypothetical protein KKB81_02985 [Candidatus Margulisbacteria bacterium]|nr:hypothetical protein [Candidatus Margulisiibacteriota bacterium]MBU1022209.1 hypothetical protein [Candidatus Margulisiibacteriota bacterium]MBU1729352.1 hypothetical protein [Candidatus Margulisiibacteriota bacterium]MBU1955625.1 hypothetical protein [Candidatus Margulisiibacteriota bacterium]
MRNSLILYVLMCLLVFQGAGLAGGGSAKGESSSPSYYTFEDLAEEMERNGSSFTFDGTNKPQNAIASLPSIPPDSNQWARGFANGISEISFPWISFRDVLERGDLVFLRTGGAAGKVVKFASSFTHVAIINNPPGEETFESLKNRGVDIYNSTENNWEHIFTYSMKQLRLDYFRISEAVDNAIYKYRGIPYFPKNISTDAMSPYHYLRKWSDKDDFDSMYCSKLVYWTFYPLNVDLDSDRTMSQTMPNMTWEYKDGRPIYSAWIGVSPDDIYYSEQLSADIFYDGLENLSEPFPGWAF